jgi:Cysteine-rich CPCC
MSGSHPCPACGFITKDEPLGDYEFCAICEWQDDPVQHDFPLSGGANKVCLVEKQIEILRRWPVHVREADGYLRVEDWRPLYAAEVKQDVPKDGMAYFEASGEAGGQYYWRRPVRS